MARANWEMVLAIAEPLGRPATVGGHCAPPSRSGLGELGSHGPLTVPSSTTGPEVTPAWGSIPYTLIALSNAPKKALGHTHTS